MSSDAFELLGLSRKGVTEAAVKKAYAAKLKQVRPEDNREGFMALRQAYEVARQYANHAERTRATRKDARDRKRVQKAAAVPDPDTMVHPSAAPEIVLEPAISQLPPTDETEIASVAAPAARDAAEDDALDNGTLPFGGGTVEIVRADDAARWQPPAEVAMQQVRELISEPWRWQDPAAWSEIVDQDALQPIDDFQEFERQLRDFVCAESGLHREDQPDRQQWMTDRVLQFFDERFGWTRGSSRNPWEQAQFHWLYSIYETCDWFSGRIPAARQFSTPTVVYAQLHAPRPRWFLHPAVALSAAYIVSAVFRYLDHTRIDPSEYIALAGPWAPPVAFIAAGFAMLAFVIVCFQAVSIFLIESLLLLGRGVRWLFRRRGPMANPGWFTVTDWLSLVIVVLAIVLIEHQIDSPPPKVDSTQPPALSVPNT